MPVNRPQLTVICGWDGQDNDVSDDVEAGGVTHGSRFANPTKSAIVVGKGTLVLTGVRYDPNSEERGWSAPSMVGKTPCRIELEGTTLWTGSIQEPKILPRPGKPLIQYKLIGLMDQRSRNNLEFLNSDPTLLSSVDEDLWNTLIGHDPVLSGDPVSYTHLTLPTIYSV